MITWAQLVVISVVAALVALVAFCVIIALNFMCDQLRQEDVITKELWADESDVWEKKREPVKLKIIDGGKR